MISQWCILITILLIITIESTIKRDFCVSQAHKTQVLYDTIRNMVRKNISSDSPWESKYGYSRAVVVDNKVFVSGTTGTDGNGKVVSNDPYLQAKHALEKIEKALKQAGSSMNNVYRYRTFITKDSIGEQVLKAHAEFFLDVKPAASLLVIHSLLDPSMVVEIEVDAYID